MIDNGSFFYYQQVRNQEIKRFPKFKLLTIKTGETANRGRSANWIGLAGGSWLIYHSGKFYFPLSVLSEDIKVLLIFPPLSTKSNRHILYIYILYVFYSWWIGAGKSGEL